MVVATRFFLLCAAVLALPAVCCLAFGLPEAISQTTCKAVSDLTAQKKADDDPLTTCGDVLFIGVHGSIEGPDKTNNPNLPNSPVIVETCDAFEKQAVERGRQIDAELLDYTSPASFSDFAIEAVPFLSSLEEAGRTKLDERIQVSLGACPAREIVLAGYSFGAWIIDDWLSRPENSGFLPRIRGVQLYGDHPLLRRHDPISGFVHEGLVRRIGQAVSPDPYTSAPLGPPGLTDRWESFCLQMDPVCGEGYPNPPITLEFQLVAAYKCTDTMTHCEHLKYARDPVRNMLGWAMA
jgi:hypothetical protein